MENKTDTNLSLVITHLMKGIIYREDKPELWNQLVTLQGPARDYFRVMGLNMDIDEAEGYAYLKTGDTPEGETPLPRLVTRRPLSYPVSLILVLLRRKLIELDAGSGESRLILSREDINLMISAFLPSGSNEVKFRKKIDSYLQRIQDLGFIHFMSDKKDKIEVRRILKAYVNAQWLDDFDKRLEEYSSHGERLMDEGADS